MKNILNILKGAPVTLALVSIVMGLTFSLMHGRWAKQSRQHAYEIGVLVGCEAGVQVYISGYTGLVSFTDRVFQTAHSNHAAMIDFVLK